MLFWKLAEDLTNFSTSRDRHVVVGLNGLRGLVICPKTFAKFRISGVVFPKKMHGVASKRNIKVHSYEVCFVLYCIFLVFFADNIEWSVSYYKFSCQPYLNLLHTYKLWACVTDRNIKQNAYTFGLLGSAQFTGSASLTSSSVAILAWLKRQMGLNIAIVVITCLTTVPFLLTVFRMNTSEPLGSTKTAETSQIVEISKFARNTVLSQPNFNFLSKR